jgi:hypothetical protein
LRIADLAMLGTARGSENFFNCCPAASHGFVRIGPTPRRKEAVEKLEWYSLRWKIETFHKIMKSGCKAEESKLRTAERLVNLLAVLCVLSWRIFWMTMINRAAPGAPPLLVFTRLELRLLDALVRDSLTSSRNSAVIWPGPTTLRPETWSCGEACRA